MFSIWRLEIRLISTTRPDLWIALVVRGRGAGQRTQAGKVGLRKTTCESENRKRRGVGEKSHFLHQAARKFYGFLNSEDISNCSKLTSDEYLWINKNNICSEAGLVTLPRPAILRLKTQIISFSLIFWRHIYRRTQTKGFSMYPRTHKNLLTLTCNAVLTSVLYSFSGPTPPLLQQL